MLFVFTKIISGIPFIKLVNILNKYNETYITINSRGFCSKKNVVTTVFFLLS